MLKDPAAGLLPAVKARPEKHPVPPKKALLHRRRKLAGQPRA